MGTELKLALGALLTELAALALLYLGSSDTALLYEFFLLHGMASAMAAPFVWAFLPPRYRQPRLAVLLLLFSVCFFIPVLGLGGFFVGVILSVWWPRLGGKLPFSEVRTPRFQLQHGPQRLGHLRMGQVRNQLSSTTVPLELRMKALLALQEVPGRQASEILRDVMADPSDDLRLLAFGMLDGKEKQLNERIHAASEALKAARDPQAEFAASKQLAELYWELVYQGLVQGDMRRYALEQVKKHVGKALAHHQADGGLWVIAGRMRMLEKDYDGARSAFESAVAKQFPRVRVEPYLAELAFLRRDFSAVRQHMKQIQTEGRSQQMALVADYWGEA